jgi:RNA polymerase sigma-70 factor (ECF subfamily)
MSRLRWLPRPIRKPPEEADVNDLAAESVFADTWREHRRYLLDIAYRMLGSVSDAEDVVQDAFARLLRADVSTIEDARGWLVVVVGRLCLDQLRSARVRRESYVGPWLPEPVTDPAAGPSDPADRITLDDSVRMALLITLEQLTPAERAAFVLHDVFQFSFDEIGAIVGRSPDACRQLASRARRRVRESAGPARFDADRGELQTLTERFIAAATAGDVAGLTAILTPDVVGWTDSGGRFGVPRTPIAGRERVISTLLGFLQALRPVLAPMPINGEPGVVAVVDGRLLSVIAFETSGRRISRIHAVASAQKLAHFADSVGLPVLPE